LRQEALGKLLSVLRVPEIAEFLHVNHHHQRFTPVFPCLHGLDVDSFRNNFVANIFGLLNCGREFGYSCATRTLHGIFEHFNCVLFRSSWLVMMTLLKLPLGPGDQIMISTCVAHELFS